jgi:rubrerythrin
MFGILTEEPIAHLDPLVQAEQLRKTLKKQQKKLKSLQAIQAKVDAGESIDTDQRIKLEQHEAVNARVLEYSTKLEELDEENRKGASAAKKKAEDRLDAVNHVLDAIDDKYICPICQECLETATTTSCGHTFCRNCILAVGPTGPTACPMCRAPLEVDGLKPAKTLRKRMAKIKRVCHCQEEVSLSSIRAHLRVCATIQRVDDIFAQPSSSPGDKNTPLSIYHKPKPSRAEQEATTALRNREEALIQHAIELSIRDFEGSS